MVEYDDPANRREHARKNVLFRTRVSVSGIAIDCELLDISTGGARVSAPLAFERNTEVVLAVDQLGNFNAVIARSHKNEHGLKFNDDPERIGEAIMLIATYG